MIIPVYAMETGECCGMIIDVRKGQQLFGVR